MVLSDEHWAALTAPLAEEEEEPARASSGEDGGGGAAAAAEAATAAAAARRGIDCAQFVRLCRCVHIGREAGVNQVYIRCKSGVNQV